MNINPVDNYRRGKEYYDMLSAKYDSWMKLVKFIAILLGSLFAGWQTMDNVFPKVGVQEIVEKVAESSGTIVHVHKFKDSAREESMPQAPQSSYPHIRSSRTSWVGVSIWSILSLFFLYHLILSLFSHYKTWKKPKTDFLK